MILHPVLARLPRGLRGRRNVDEARRLGRLALEHSSRLAHRPPAQNGADPFPRDDARAPLPARDPRGVTWHWSTTNTPGLAAAVVAPCRVGIDAEWLDRPRIEAALDYFADDERARLGLDERRGVLALWSAKEAVLKHAGTGMAGMGRVCVERILEPAERLVLGLDGSSFEVALLWKGEHVIALACARPGFEVRACIHEEALA